MAAFTSSSRAVEAGGALQGMAGVGPRQPVAASGFVEPAVFRRILALGQEARADVVRRGKRLVKDGRLAADPEAIAGLLLGEGARPTD
jgi:hypothetical protein